MNTISAGLSDIGQVRKTNQDSIGMHPEENVFILADGMGGHSGGDIASKLAVDSIAEYFLAEEREKNASAIREAILYANSKIKETSAGDKNLENMGTTVVMMAFVDSTLHIGNVGDSRAYLVHQEMLYQLSRDHSLVQEKLNLGIYTRDQVISDPQKNVLTRTVGFEHNLEVDVYNYPYKRGDLFMICSDGLYGKVTDQNILSIINQHIPNPADCKEEQIQKALDQLLETANANGGNDNISCIIAVTI